jgi:hypothetical protein
VSVPSKSTGSNLFPCIAVFNCTKAIYFLRIGLRHPYEVQKLQSQFFAEKKYVHCAVIKLVDSVP